MVVIASKNSHVGFEQQDRQVSFFYTSLLCSNQRIPPTPWLNSVRTMWRKMAQALDGDSRLVWSALGVQLSRRDLLDLTLGSVLGAGGVIASNVLPSWLGLVGGLSLLAAGVRIAWQPSSRLMKNISLTDN